MPKPTMFIASSVDNLDLAYAAQEGLEHDVEPTVWTQGVFQLSKSTMASLMDRLDQTDFGLFVLAPSDAQKIKSETKDVVRDNVIFELGLFIGKLGPERCFMIVPRDSEELHLPTDLLGLTPAYFDADRQDGNMVAALGPACSKIRKSVKLLGSLQAEVIVAGAEIVQETQLDELCSDPDDCKSLIQSWMGHRPASDNTKAIRFADVDRELGLAPGSTEAYIAEVATRWNYIPVRKGKETILFQQRPYSMR
ncbi:nucleotide-binding protein [Xanthobacter sp. 91]|uniref:TIR domain-containing protein n=1 Tax=Xanthobacter sp. 91 TaxID=1117244 RepID=UPI0018CBF3D8|nr:nucleotide-binding protein [Xanthobacter sp. 91]